MEKAANVYRNTVTLSFLSRFKLQLLLLILENFNILGNNSVTLKVFRKIRV